MKVKLVNEPIGSDYGKNLLRARGIKDIEKFLNPNSSCLQNWEDLDNIKEGINLFSSIPSNARIALIIDCDVDGFTSAAIIYQYLKKFLPHLVIDCYLHDGKAHGLEEHWETIQNLSYNLVIIPDAGTNDSQYAIQLNCPILVIDHHLAEDTAFAQNMIIINNQISSKYRNKNLSGAGMVYQFCRAMDYYFEKDFAKEFIDLAALGICADMMSGLEVENQYFWKEGFSNIRNYFFLSLARKQAYSITGKMGPSDREIEAALNPTSVAFYIVPLINAMIRVGTESEKERLWLAFVDGHRMVKSNKRGANGAQEEVAIESTRECTNARSHQNKFLDNATEQLEIKIFNHDLLNNKVLFVRLDEEDFPSELNGLIAMRLSQKYKRPTIVARLNDEGFVRGSARGLNNSELTSFKNYLGSTGLFEYTQGHDQAFGISIPNRNLSELHERANKDLAQYDFGEDYYEVNFTRHALDKDLSLLIEDLARYKNIWSQMNNEPLIYIKDLHFTFDDIQIMGKKSDTVKITKNGVSYLKFFGKDMIEELSKYQNIRMEIVGRANLNTWNGMTAPQIFIEQYEIKENKLTDF